MRTGIIYTEGPLKTHGIICCFVPFVLIGLLRSECVHLSTIYSLYRTLENAFRACIDE